MILESKAVTALREAGVSLQTVEALADQIRGALARVAARRDVRKYQSRTYDPFRDQRGEIAQAVQPLERGLPPQAREHVPKLIQAVTDDFDREAFYDAQDEIGQFGMTVGQMEVERLRREAAGRSSRYIPNCSDDD